MNEVKKDHSTGTGAVTGAMPGAAVGTVAGAVGTAVGAVAGGVLGAKAGDGIAKSVNPTEYQDHFQAKYRNTPYYTAGRAWRDYEPAYRYGYDTFDQYRGRRFDEIDGELQRNWDATRADSRLQWNEAKQAVRDGWHHIERRMPGDAGRNHHAR